MSARTERETKFGATLGVLLVDDAGKTGCTLKLALLLESVNSMPLKPPPDDQHIVKITSDVIATSF